VGAQASDDVLDVVDGEPDRKADGPPKSQKVTSRSRQLRTFWSRRLENLAGRGSGRIPLRAKNYPAKAMTYEDGSQPLENDLKFLRSG
jgi:hypothetical protein